MFEVASICVAGGRRKVQLETNTRPMLLEVLMKFGKGTVPCEVRVMQVMSFVVEDKDGLVASYAVKERFWVLHIRRRCSQQDTQVGLIAF